MLQYIHDGHQGKERCLLRARNTVFWPKITYDIQELIERCIICQEHGRSQSIIGVTQELPPFPWHTLATDIFYWKRMDFLIVADVFSKYFLVRKLANSTSAAVCAEIATIVTELGLPHVIRSDNGPCYNSKEFQQMLQCYNITHQTSSPHHPISNGFVERMVGVAKKLMDKAGSEGKLWISGLYEYRVTPQSGSIASPLQLITQRTPREKDLPQLPSTLGAQEMYETHQEILRRQPNQPERNYIELTPGMAVWVQHRQNTSWEPATVVSQSSSNSYWIMQENGTDQPKVYRRTRSMLKIRCTDIRQPRQEYSQFTETEKAKFQTPSACHDNRNFVRHNFVEKFSPDLVHPTKSDTSSASDSIIDFLRKHNIFAGWTAEGKFKLISQQEFLVESLEILMDGPMIYNKQEVTVPGRKLAVIKVSIEIAKTMNGQMFAVKPNFLLTNEHPNLVIVPMLHQVRGEKQECIPLTLLNLAEDESIFLKKGEY